ncbi:FG-GAP repeat protein [Vibrio alginolyticus]|uniref:FG-GAP repeat protein n=1 Tax=Vibrio alginolyticus TaxID=663 RepID=UPI0023B18EB3|nr:FG-GAP repeat protein [Vibrio alginolyticus]WED61602.1 FG-GAP repeat protein [Vibrio alginolyticus]
MKNILIILLISFTSLSMAGYVTIILNKGDMIINDNEQQLGGSEGSEIAKIPTNLQSKIIASDGISNDLFGSSVAVSDEFSIVGASSDDSKKGAAYVYKNNGTEWVQVDKLTASDGVANDRFGFSIAMNADTAIIGSLADDNWKGAAYIFKYNGSEWVQVAKLTASDGSSGNRFGRSVAISGDIAIIGATSANGYKGAAYVFKNNGSEWIQVAKLTASDGVSNDMFGISVAINGNTAIVGINRNAAYVFKNNGSEWVQVAKLTANDGSSSDMFGFSIAMVGDSVIFGAYGDDNNSGSAYVFENNGSDWVQVAKLTASDGSGEHWFGYSVATSGDVAVVGAYGDNNKKGAAYLFKNNGSEWVEEAKLTVSDGTSNDMFGISVAMSAETAIVGSSGDDSSKGSAYIFVPE